MLARLPTIPAMEHPGTPPPRLERAGRELAPHRTAVAWTAALALAWAVWASGPGWSTPALACAAAAGAALAVVDARTHRLPDAVVLPGTTVVGLLLTLAALAGSTWDAALRAAIGGVGLCLAYLLLHLTHRSGLGLGDVKLAALVGMVAAWYGWDVLWAAALLPFMLGGFAAIGLLVTRRATRTTAIAFGPYMLMGAALAVSWSRLAGG